MGSADRIIRLVIAAVVAILFFTNVISGTFGIVLLALAVVFVFCIYQMVSGEMQPFIYFQF
jgi:predicted membrane protein